MDALLKHKLLNINTNWRTDFDPGKLSEALTYTFGNEIQKEYSRQIISTCPTGRQNDDVIKMIEDWIK